MKYLYLIFILILTIGLVSCGQGPKEPQFLVDIDNEYLPEPDEFVPVEVLAEMIHEEPPVYPSEPIINGWEGRAWVNALVDKRGLVRDVTVNKTSGYGCLDQAAIDAAYKYKFSPAIQNGNPVAIWVTFKIEFELNTQ